MDFPRNITGGCLCGAVQYSLSPSIETSWPPVSSACQCTMCRKWTSSLIAQFLVVSASQLQPPLDTLETYLEYESSPRRFRGFCGKCGTSLLWRSADDVRTVDLYLGTIDEQWLVHEGQGEVGRTLATPNGTQFWMENAVAGVTDLMQGGQRHLKEGDDGWQLRNQRKAQD